MDFSLISFSVTTVLSDRKYKEDCMVDSEGGIQNVVIQTGGERKSSSGDIFWWQMSNQGVSGFFSLPGVSVGKEATFQIKVLTIPKTIKKGLKGEKLHTVYYHPPILSTIRGPIF